MGRGALRAAGGRSALRRAVTPVALAREIPGAELLALEHIGYEYFPPATWDVVVSAILRHTAGADALLKRARSN